MLFDARVLAAYLVSSNVFANPLTRRPLRRETCASLDAHLEKHGRAKDATVARALDLSRDDDAQRRLQSERLRAESRRVLAALFGGDAESLGARQVRLAEDAARRAERGGGGLVVEDADVGVFQEAAPSAAPRPPPPDSAESYPVLESAPRRRDDAAFWARRAQAAPRGLFSAPPRPVWKSTSASGARRWPRPSWLAWRRRDDSARMRRKILISAQAAAPGRAVDERPPARAEPAPRGRVRRRSTARRANGRVAAGAGPLPCGGERREMLIHTQVLWAQRTLATHVDGLAGGGGALRALERKLARCCEADGEVPLPARATRADSTRAAEVAALYGLRAEEYADGAVRYLSCRRLPGARPPQPLLSEHAATAPPPPAPAPTAPPPPRARATVTHVVDLRPVHARERARHDGLPGVRRGATSGGRSRRPARRTGGAGAVSAARGDAYYLGNARVRRRRRRGRRRRLDAAVAREGVDRRAGRRVRLLPRALGVGKHESDGVLRYDPPRAVSFGLAGGRAAVVHGGRPRRRIGDVSQLQAGHPALNLRAAEPAHAVRLACLM